MGSSQTVTAKYVIRAQFDVEGVVEKPDVIGAVFGQTEGLFGPELDLRELQKSGRIGRIEIKLESKKDKTNGNIDIPTSLDRVTTAIIAASIESINRVGPCEANVTVKEIEDIRDARRSGIITRAKDILQEWTLKTVPETEDIYRQVSEALRLARAEKYGSEGLTAGPDVASSKELIIVEGRADVITLLRSGIQNVIALEGAKIPETIIKLSREKEATAFLDGDRGGDLILKELLQVTNIKYVARAPRKKEVEDLTPREIEAALERRVPAKKPKAKRKRPKVRLPKRVVDTADKLEGTLEAVLFSKDMKEIERLPVSKLADKLDDVKDVDTVVFDGVITQRLVDIASKKNINYLVAARISDKIKQPLNMNLVTLKEIKG